MNTPFFSEDTIYAPATAPGKAGVAVIRISGPRAAESLALLTGKPLPAPRRATTAALRDPQTGEILDHGLALYFPGPGSYTGEDVVELQVHGGRAVMQSLLSALSHCPGLRMAEPGEFTRRAFIHGKIDLTEAEGIADLIEADTAAQRRQALRQLEGVHGAAYESLRATMLHALAFLEAYLDFPEEEIPESVLHTLQNDINQAKTTISGMLDNNSGERIRDGYQIVILGAPNAGKSTLLNLLAGRDAAIVSDIAGTTRDIVEVHLDLEGYPVTLIDTAGLRDSEDVIEAEGIRRARSRAATADLKLALFDASTLPSLDEQTCSYVDDRTLCLLTKSDLLASPSLLPQSIGGAKTAPISLISHDSYSQISTLLTERLLPQAQCHSAPVITRARHRQALIEAQACLNRLSLDNALELAAEDLRLAARSIGKITGRIEVDDVLDVVFRSFCIGK